MLTVKLADTERWAGYKLYWNLKVHLAVAIKSDLCLKFKNSDFFFFSKLRPARIHDIQGFPLQVCNTYMSSVCTETKHQRKTTTNGHKRTRSKNRELTINLTSNFNKKNNKKKMHINVHQRPNYSSAYKQFLNYAYPEANSWVQWAIGAYMHAHIHKCKQEFWPV